MTEQQQHPSSPPQELRDKWREAQTAEELISQIENEALRVLDSKMPVTRPPWIMTKDLYDKAAAAFRALEALPDD